MDLAWPLLCALKGFDLSHDGDLPANHTGCGARAASGHAIPPLSSVMNSRRFNSLNCICYPCVYRKPRPFDRVTESRNVSRDDRADIFPLDPVCLALQAKEPI
jgi:hypothetical protein